MNENPVWVWWSPGEAEDGLMGFTTAEERDRFNPKDPGPYQRLVSPDGKTISQMESWGDRMAHYRDVLNRKIIR